MNFLHPRIELGISAYKTNVITSSLMEIKVEEKRPLLLYNVETPLR